MSAHFCTGFNLAASILMSLLVQQCSQAASGCADDWSRSGESSILEAKRKRSSYMTTCL